MPITVLDNARGFEEGLQYANNVYNRIQDFAKHKQEQKSLLARHRSQMASQQYRDSMGLIEAGATSQDPGQREATRQFVNQLNTAIYNQPANMQGMYNKNYTEDGITDYPEEMANNDMTPGANYWKTMTTPIEPPATLPPPRANGTGIPMNDVPVYIPPTTEPRIGNIFDQISNPNTTPLMGRDMGENNVGDIEQPTPDATPIMQQSYPQNNNNIFDQIANRNNHTPPVMEQLLPENNVGNTKEPPAKKKGKKGKKGK